MYFGIGKLFVNKVQTLFCAKHFQEHSVVLAIYFSFNKEIYKHFGL